MCYSLKLARATAQLGMSCIYEFHYISETYFSSLNVTYLRCTCSSVRRDAAVSLRLVDDIFCVTCHIPPQENMTGDTKDASDCVRSQ